MKKIISIAIAICAILALSSCGKSGDADKKTTEAAATETKAPETEAPYASVAGTYTGVHCKFVGSEEWEDEVFSIVLNADGTGVFTRDDYEFKLTFTLDGEEFRMTETFIGAANEYKGTLKAGELHIYTGGEPEDELAYEYVLEKSN